RPQVRPASVPSDHIDTTKAIVSKKKDRMARRPGLLRRLVPLALAVSALLNIAVLFRRPISAEPFRLPDFSKAPPFLRNQGRDARGVRKGEEPWAVESQ